ncbi:MAG: delta-60 repeat domain-containing protein [Chthoniobacterales bacterium]
MKRLFPLVCAALTVLIILPAFAQDDDSDSGQPAPPLSAFQGGLGVNGTIYALAIQSDGKIILGGQFATVNGIPRSNLARLNADGTLDRTIFEQEPAGTNGPVYALAIEPQGGILVGGLFSMAGKTPRMNLARFNVDGATDKNFDGGKGPNGRVQAIITQPDGKFIAAGEFSQVGGIPRNNIARFNADTTLDQAVTSARNPLTGPTKALAGLPNGNFVAGGFFVVGEVPTRSIIQLPAPIPASR